MESLSDKILIVDDDENISEILNMYLESSGYTTKIASTGKRAQELFLEYNPNLVLLDVMIPGIDGIDVLKWVRKQGEVPVIMLTAKGDTFDKVLALELGADDYIVKPFEPKELLARVKAVLRRYSADNAKSEIIKLSDLSIDPTSYKVIFNKEDIKMPPKEFELLYYLAKIKIEYLQENNYFAKYGGMITLEILEQLMFI
ncbi:Putative two-component response regulator [Clostridium neonatale]|uniref:Stage 0 sporulation protein A homolog n=1 Tax=Clostridium neonatale TaxID=137838 RepID=A0AA86MM44_9CLOT|nr:Putative two-component response regulator [Clostridium neonatale]CAH0434878.1 Putative two-component response regulator [Clostridium neonatale]